MNKLQAATDTVKELLCWYVILLFAAAGVYMFAEHTSLDDALYWAATTATSTGYGDLSPKTIAGRIDAVLLMHISIFVIAPMMIVRLIDRMRVDPNVFTDEEQKEVLEHLRAIRDKVGEPDYGKSPRLAQTLRQLRNTYYHMLRAPDFCTKAAAASIKMAIDQLEKVAKEQ
jgi:voltage-gated potassium channel